MDVRRSFNPFLPDYNPSELNIAAEFLTKWLPFLSWDLCDECSRILSNRIRTLGREVGGSTNLSIHSSSSTKQNTQWDDLDDHVHVWGHRSNNDHNYDTLSLGSWKDAAEDSDPPELCKVGANSSSAPVIDTPPPDISTPSIPDRVLPAIQYHPNKMSWADMAEEDDDLEKEDPHVKNLPEDVGAFLSNNKKSELSREQRERIRFEKVKREKSFICLERINGKIVNILDGLELHTGIFSAAEQRKIVAFVYQLEKMGMNEELKERTFSAPRKWMRGKGRVTIQFGCCYNYAADKSGNPPGILQNMSVDPLPNLFKVMIKRLVTWHVIHPSRVPDSCIVNIYNEGDCIPPHIDHHDFARPFCTVSFLSECNIVFGSNLTTVAPGEFSGAFEIPLPVGSVLVLNGKGADVAKHCVPAVPSKRISITFRRMDESKRPFDFVPDPELQGLQPLCYEEDNDVPSRLQKSSKAQHNPRNRESSWRHNHWNGAMIGANR